MRNALTVLVVLFVVAVLVGFVWLIFTMADAWRQNAQDVLSSGRRRRGADNSRSNRPEDERP